MKEMPYIHTELELSEFEKRWNIKLPKPYRDYLLSVGGSMWSNSKVDILEDWSYELDGLPENYLSSDFLHKRA